MSSKDGYRRYFEAAAVLGEITRARAEGLVRELMSSGDVQRAQAQQWVDELVGRSRKAAEDLVDLVRTEVSKQMQTFGLDAEELARQAAEVLLSSMGGGRRTVHDESKGATASQQAKKLPAKKATAKKATAKKATAKKATAKKATAKKATAKKATAKKATAKKRAATTSAPGTRSPAPPPAR